MSDDDMLLAYPHGDYWLVETLPRGADDSGDPAVLEGARRRTSALLSGVCPCGATVQLPNRAARRAAVREGRTLRARVEHEDDCPALHPALAAQR